MRHCLTRVLPYTPGQLFALVGDVERYPQFVRWVTDLRTFNRRAIAEGLYLLDADAGVRFSFVRERFTTRVQLDAANLAVDVELIRGPFRRLENHWRFSPHPVGVALSFEIDFEFHAPLLNMLLHANQDHAMRRLITCFEERASALYGPGAVADASSKS